MQKLKASNRANLSWAGMLVTIGIVYGDIGTSPLYTMKAIVEGNGGLSGLNYQFLLGSVSLIFWTLTLMTTIKYVCIALNADNDGEGGIFSLYALVKRRYPFLLIPAMIGGAALLSDGVLTPAVTVTSSIEGLRGVPLYQDLVGDSVWSVVAITLVILCVLFSVQHFGTNVIGKLFGPVMTLWFLFMAFMGIYNLSLDWSFLKALNPYYAIQVLLSPDNKRGLFILGSVFLATTGAEALYSDLGHVGKRNIHLTWPLVKLALVLNYMGQAAWLYRTQQLQPNYEVTNPFYNMVPQSLLIPAIIMATLASIIASQALITGAFSLTAEAIRLNLFPKLYVIYNGYQKGQLYLPTVNHLLAFGCIAL